MNNFKNYVRMLAMTAALCGGMVSCVSDEPFAGEGDASLRMKLVINSDVTRSEVSDDNLRSNCVVYISGQKGLLYKYKGLENVPEEIRLKTGSYVVEAWTGDSVPASFTSRFFRGYRDVTVGKGVNQVVLKCGVRNVVVSVNAATIDTDMMKDYTITVASPTGSLDFNQDNVADAKGYYMLSSKATQLTYTVSGKTAEGRDFTKTAVIKGLDGGDVRPGHEYVLNFSYNPSYVDEGGAFINVTIDDSEILVEDEIEILGRPSLSGVDFDLDRQVVGNAGNFTDKVVKVVAFGAVSRMSVKTDAPLGFPGSEFDLMNLSENASAEVKATGFSWDVTYNADRNLSTMYLTFPAALLNRLPEGDSEYRVELCAVDKYGKDMSGTLRLAVGQGAVVIEDPVTLNFSSADRLAVGARRAEIGVTLVDPSAENPGLEYRPADSDGEWTFVGISDAARNSAARSPRKAPAQEYKVKLRSLQPGTRYVVRAAAGEFRTSEKEYVYITTETPFSIPNAGMEDWSAFADNSKVQIPSADGTVSFWDSGNHGSATMDVNLTQGLPDLLHGGAKAARLKSQFVGVGGFIGKFAAGNLFAGQYLETEGTDGKLLFGRQYNGSHPTSMKVWVNYRPKVAVKGINKGGNDKYIAVGQLDKGQIYVALSTAPVTIRTKDAAALFEPEADCILAYGEKTFEGDFAADGSMELVDIPLKYYDRAHTNDPLYLIIVCSASKYGDYFSGGEGSLMVVDDFELVYE